MKKVTFEESKRIQLDILLYFDDFCKRNGLHYSLGEGTLIGAVRHKGFIPWDDDIDVLMLREDYDKFINNYKGKYRLISPRTEKHWLFCHSRLADERTIVEWNSPYEICNHGLWIGVFPIDNFPDNLNEWEEIKLKRDFWFNIILMKIGEYPKFEYDKNVSLFKNIKRIVKRFLSLLIPYHIVSRKFESLISTFKDVPTNSKALMVGVWHDPWVCSSDVFSSFTEVEFEGYKLPAFNGYDAYLRSQYGDYMQLPPVEERIPKHNYIAYWKTNNAF